jgi:hypothetical protein
LGNERDANAFWKDLKLLKTWTRGMADKITLGGIGYFLAALTLLVAVMGTMVVLDYTSGRLNLDGTLKTTAEVR